MRRDDEDRGRSCEGPAVLESHESIPPQATTRQLARDGDSPCEPRVLYRGVKEWMIRSTDKGVTWECADDGGDRLFGLDGRELQEQNH